MGDDVRARLGEDERDDLCDAVMGYTHTRPAAAPERFDRYIVPAVERILAAHIAAAVEVATCDCGDWDGHPGDCAMWPALRRLAAHPAPGGGA